MWAEGDIGVAGRQTASATVTGSCLWAQTELDPARITKLCETHSYTHTHNVIKKLSINQQFAWLTAESLEGGMENMARCFAKVERKKNRPLATRSLLCSCCMRVMAQMRSCYSTAFLQ